jgi:hypothetical protein
MDEPSREIERLPLSKACELLLEECRMVLPGIQALLGFQLIVAFNPGFHTELSRGEQRIHLFALIVIALAVGLIMTPAAFHRQTNPRQVTAAFIRLSTGLLMWSLLPLALGICADLYLIGRIIVGPSGGAWIASVVFAAFLTLWYAVPRLSKLKTLRASASRVRDARPPRTPQPRAR